MIIMMIVFSDIDLSDSRLFYFENITNFENTNYIDAYARLKPVLYLYFEPDRFSIIGITHQEYLELFYSPGHLYPHNIFLELIIIYGWFGIFVTIIVMYLMFKLVLLIFNTRITFFTIFCYSIIALFLSTMLYGDMGDNGAVLGTIFAIFWHLDILKKVKN